MAYYDPPALLTPDSGSPAYTSRHTRSKSYSHRPQVVTGPPPSHLGAPQTGNRYLATANEPPQTPTVSGTVPLYRRHSKKKSSQILVEPMGAQHQINYMPMSPTVAIPQGLENIIQPPPMTPVFPQHQYQYQSQPHPQSQPQNQNHGNSLTVFTTGHAGMHHQQGMLSPASAASNTPGSRYIAYGSSPTSAIHPSFHQDPPPAIQLNKPTSLEINSTASSLSSSSTFSSSPSSSASSFSVPVTPASAVEHLPLTSVETTSLSQPQQLHLGPSLPFPVIDGSVSSSANIKNATVSRSSSSSASGFRKVHGHNRTISMGEFDRHSRYAPPPPLPPFPAYLGSSPSPGASSLKSSTVASQIPSGTAATSPSGALPSILSNSSSGPLITSGTTNTNTDSGIPGAAYLPTNFQKPRTHSNASSKSLVSGSASPISIHSSLASSPIIPAAPPVDDKPLSRSSSVSSTNLENRQQAATLAATATDPPSSPSSPSPPSPTSNKFSTNTLTSGASVLIAGQFFSKLVTFSLNQLIFRFVGPEVVGANSQLELFVSTILFFSREAIRLATQRQTLSGKRPDVYRFEGGVVENTLSGTVQEVINIGFLPVLMGIPLAAILSFTYLHYNNTPDDSRTISIAVAIFALAAIIELASEPAFLLFQLKLQFKKRASFESIAVTCRCILTFFISLADHRNNVVNSIIAFAVGQLAYASVLTGLYIFEGLKEAHAGQYELTYPRPIWKDVASEKTTADMLKNGNHRAAATTTASSTVSVGQETKTYFNASTMQLATSIWLQTVFKHCLTEGDKFLVSLFLPMADQGVYAVVVNYGSLIARLVFLPIEEALRSFFSKILSNDAENISAPDMELSILVLSTLLRFYSYLSLFALTFGPVVAAYLLQFLVSKVWYAQTDAAVVLATYACYIPFLAMNGALEAFVQSVATPADIKHQSSVMLIFSLSFSAAAYLLMRPLGLGAQGLVLANMFNMAQRIGWCLMWIESYYKKLRENSDDIAKAAVEIKQELSEEKKKEELITKEKETTTKAKATGTDAQTSTGPHKRKNAIVPEKEDAIEKSELDESDKKDNDNDESTKEKTAPSHPTPENRAQQTASHCALAYSPWGWLRLAIPSPVVLASFVLLILPVSWLLVGRAARLTQFAQQVALALGLAVVVAVAERELLLGAGRNFWAKISSQRSKRRA
ncbi:uncharacterized protein SAPINGB_P001329 [Magnusiomyces paraingens]|uniref:Man(5)GlcNAc(2)-PP-dolichol translocation protein RFT1 n=1 Tax=Magnusiomyces paraingens TaxID=2606893 RepID=A0A5E8B561_9ASCO|nr:uncharacterized protein SAPINGB_P001329 [Saprochaete ingens]VVT46671.1 unnamed protein product [Saprochaete ingens]